MFDCYDKSKEEFAADTFVKAGRDLANLNPDRLLKECRNIAPQLTQVLDNNLPCMEDFERFKGDFLRGAEASSGHRKNGTNSVTKKKPRKNKRNRYPTYAEAADRYMLRYTPKGGVEVWSKPNISCSIPTKMTFRIAPESGHVKLSVTAPARNGKDLYVSHLVFLLHHKRWPQMMKTNGSPNNGLAVIHKDGDLTNNHPSNLKEAESQENINQFLFDYKEMGNIYE